MTYWLLFYEFFKTGLFSIGGGLATMPFLYDMADKYPWFSRAFLVDMIAVSESTPGPIGVNMATYAGFMAAGIPGGLLATFALILPSFLIMLGLVRVLDKFKENKYVQQAFYGLRPAVVALIASAGLGVAALTLIHVGGTYEHIFSIDFRQLILFVLLFLGLRLYKKMQPLYLIAAAGVTGVIIGM
jgi:chromate transporter